MGRRPVVFAAVAFSMIGTAGPNAFANCNPPKYIDTYNAATGAYAYWRSALAETPGGSLVTKMWSGAVDVTGTCNFLYFGAGQGDIGLSGDFGQACLPGSACPSGSVSVLAAVVKGAGTEFLVTQAPETPAGAVNFDFSGTSHPMIALTRPRITAVSRVSATKVQLSIIIDAVSGGLYEGSADQIAGYNILRAEASADPGRLPDPYTLIASVPAPGGAAATAQVTSDFCITYGLDDWLVVQVVSAAGPFPVVGAAARISCWNLADPKRRNAVPIKPAEIAE